MNRTVLIRFGGLVAMVGGVLYALERYRGSVEVGPPFVLLLATAMVAIVSIAVLLQRERYRWSGVLVSLISLVGLVLILVGNQAINSVTGSESLAYWGFMALLAGVFAATGGLVALALATAADARVLPWWAGVALVAGSPVGVLLLIMLPSMLSESLVEGPWQLLVEALPGVPWVLVGYAILRAGVRQPEQPSRVR